MGEVFKRHWKKRSQHVLMLLLPVVWFARGHTFTDTLGSFHDVCEKCDYTYGSGYVSYPNQCDKFIQCWEQQKTYLVKSCPAGLHWDTLAETCNYPCEARCVWGYDSCQLKWSEILKTDSNGGVLTGRKVDLQAALEKGTKVKMFTETYLTNGYSIEFDNCMKTNQDVCCQGLIHLGYSNWEEFNPNVYWWMINVCTTGHWHMVRYYVGGSYLSQTRTKGTFSWFVLKNRDGSFQRPVYSTGTNGSIVSGARNALIRAIEQGNPVSIFSEHKSVFPLHNTEVTTSSDNSKMVSAEHVWSISQTKVGNHFEYKNNAYWRFLILTSSGTRDISRWSLGSHTSRGHSNDHVALDWFVDGCWTRVHSTGRQGSETTLKHLRQLVESGHSVRVKFDNTVMEADNIRISNAEISVQLVSALARENAKTFKENLNWEFRVLGTSGTVRTYRSLVGSATNSSLGTTVVTMDLTWFVDTKKWNILFHIDKNGSVITGSSLAVRHALQEGVEIRVGYRLPGDQGFRYSRMDNFFFGPKPHLSAQLVRSLRDHPVEQDEFKLDDHPHWSFILVNTNGYVRTTEWVVGEHVNRGRMTERAEVKWFSCL